MPSYFLESSFETLDLLQKIDVISSLTAPCLLPLQWWNIFTEYRGKTFASTDRRAGNSNFQLQFRLCLKDNDSRLVLSNDLYYFFLQDYCDCYLCGTDITWLEEAGEGFVEPKASHIWIYTHIYNDTFSCYNFASFVAYSNCFYGTGLVAPSDLLHESELGIYPK